MDIFFVHFSKVPYSFPKIQYFRSSLPYWSQNLSGTLKNYGVIFSQSQGLLGMVTKISEQTLQFSYVFWYQPTTVQNRRFPKFQNAKNVHFVRSTSMTVYRHILAEHSLIISTNFQHRRLINAQRHLNNNVITMYKRWTNHQYFLNVMSVTISHII